MAIALICIYLHFRLKTTYLILSIKFYFWINVITVANLYDHKQEFSKHQPFLPNIVTNQPFIFYEIIYLKHKYNTNENQTNRPPIKQFQHIWLPLFNVLIEG